MAGVAGETPPPHWLAADESALVEVVPDSVDVEVNDIAESSSGSWRSSSATSASSSVVGDDDPTSWSLAIFITGGLAALVCYRWQWQWRYWWGRDPGIFKWR
jgi:hypothetical protein